MMFFYDHNMSWWGYAGMGVGMVLFWALIIAGIIALIRFSTADRGRSAPLPPPAPPSQTPEQVLAARFARGEISETEYRDRLAVLREHARS